MRAGAAACRVAIVAGMVALAGCSRQPPRFVPPNADSSLAVKPDSFAVLVGMALEQWESEGGSPAAQATARLLLDDLRRHADGPLADRARTFLDSCGFSAEVAGGADLVVINVFSRSDPTGGAWPNLFWRKRQTRHELRRGAGGSARPARARRSCRATRLSRRILGKQLLRAAAWDNFRVRPDPKDRPSAFRGSLWGGAQPSAGQLREHFAQFLARSLGLCPGRFKHIVI